MGNYTSQLRRVNAFHHNEEREAKKRQKDIQRALKEEAKRSAIEQARLEVAAYEGAIDVLLSMHREEPEFWDWKSIANSLPPHAPTNLSPREMKALSSLIDEPNRASEIIRLSRSEDEREFQADLVEFGTELADWKSRHALGNRILAGDSAAYLLAIDQCAGFDEMTQLGSSFHFIAHNPELVEGILKVNGRDAIPAEMKSLTASEKVSVKPMPKARFQCLYQDYVCSAILRVARDLFALLPIRATLLTATVSNDGDSGAIESDTPVLSVAIHRTDFDGLNFTSADPSDTIERLNHRGEVKANRAGNFAAIEPLTVEDVMPQGRAIKSLSELLTVARLLRTQIAQRSSESADTTSDTD